MRKKENSPADNDFGQEVDDGRRLYEILQMGSEPKAVREEALGFLKDVMPNDSLVPVHNAFEAALDLYAGEYPGYRGCNTGYHDLRHILETFLAMARLAHGAILEGKKVEGLVPVCLMAALFHDSGYIQKSRDSDGTGAKYTEIHVARSVSFLEKYGNKIGLSEDDIHAARLMVRCTDLAEDISTLSFPSSEIRFLGEMLNVSDLWAQMADRIYLEKLFFLFSEFQEGKIEIYQNQADMLRKTIGFYHFIKERYKFAFNRADVLMVRHFEERWKISENLYRVAIRKHKTYLMEIVKLPERDLFQKLKRSGIARETADNR